MERFAWKGRIKPGMQAEYKRLLADKAYVEDVLKTGAERAQRIAGRILHKVRRKVGLE